MRILLDENLPESLVLRLRAIGHHVDSVNSLRLKGLDNGTLYRKVAKGYDLCFTRDAGFARSVQMVQTRVQVKLLRVTLPQTKANQFVATFIQLFESADWSRYVSGDDWP